MINVALWAKAILAISKLMPGITARIAPFRDVAHGQTEISLTLADGTEHDFDLSVSALEDPRSRPVGRVLILREITERKRTEREREQLIQELQSYAHTVAHDLKNPVRGIVGYLDLVLNANS